MITKSKNYDDFASKLRQDSVIETLKKYILWQREIRKQNNNINFRNGESFSAGPVSINLDITASCNYSCVHCVDRKILNTRDKFNLGEVNEISKILSCNGLKSVILIGGGEPTLHPKFESIVCSIKAFGLQLGIVTNGSKIKKLIEVSNFLKEGDWIRLSLDAGTDETFQKIHRPKTKVNLIEISSGVKYIKKRNDMISVGFSYIVFYDDCNINGIKLTNNINEIPISAELAARSGFDYISFKPCLIKAESTLDRETLLYGESKTRIERIVNKIKEKMREAKENCEEKIKINESINLRAMLGDDLTQYKCQPRNCHSQVFRQVITPTGIYHCPAYRGDPKALIGPKDGYISQQKFKQTVCNNLEVLYRFDTIKECKDIVCFYNRLNWWIEEFINSDEDVDSIEPIPDDNCFL